MRQCFDMTGAGIWFPQTIRVRTTSATQSTGTGQSHIQHHIADFREPNSSTNDLHRIPAPGDNLPMSSPSIIHLKHGLTIESGTRWLQSRTGLIITVTSINTWTRTHRHSAPRNPDRRQLPVIENGRLTVSAQPSARMTFSPKLPMPPPNARMAIHRIMIPNTCFPPLNPITVARTVQPSTLDNRM